MNADLGTCSTDETTKLTIGKHGLQQRNEKGTDTISLLQTNNLQVATMHFEHDDYITWTSFGRTKSKHQLDHWVTNKLDTIHDAKVTELGVDSDHSATLICIDLKTARRKRKKEKTTLCYALLQNKDIREKYNEKIATHLPPPQQDQVPAWSSLVFAIKKATEETISVVTPTLTGWYKMSKEIITPLVKQRSRIIHRVRNDSSIPVQQAKQMCIDARKNLSEAIQLAKAKWVNELADSIKRVHTTPKDAWKAVKELQAGLTGHHVKPTNMRFRMPNGKLSQRDTEHMQILKPHFSIVFNNKQPIEWSAVNKIPQRPT